MDRDAIKRSTARLAGKAREDATRLQQGIYDVDGRVDGLERDYSASWKWLKENFPLDGYVRNLVEGWASVRTGAFKVIYNALDAVSAELKNLVDEKHAEGKRYTDEKHKTAVEHADEGDQVLSDSVANLEGRLDSGLRSVRKSVTDLAAELPEHKRVIYAEVGRRLDAALTDLETYKGEIRNLVTANRADLERALGRLADDIEFLSGEYQSLGNRYGAHLSGRPPQRTGIEEPPAMAPSIIEGGEIGTPEGDLEAALEQAEGTVVGDGTDAPAVEANVPNHAEPTAPEVAQPPQADLSPVVAAPPEAEVVQPPADQVQPDVAGPTPEGGQPNTDNKPEGEAPSGGS